jgi:deazaflavin-dependent oxidoreductase (nitroreductase family)
MQWLGVWLTSHGLAPSYAVTLEVSGRKSGILRRTPVVQVNHKGAGYVVALAGESEWVKNVRAADGEAVIKRRSKRAVRLVELPIDERPGIIEAYIGRGGRRGTRAGNNEARYYFGLSADPTPEELTAAAPYYPVFRIDDR